MVWLKGRPNHQQAGVFIRGVRPYPDTEWISDGIAGGRPSTPNLTWTVTEPVDAEAQSDGFIATTRVSAMVKGQYSAQVTRQSPAVQGGAGTPSGAPSASKQALIGALPTPSFLANVNNKGVKI